MGRCNADPRITIVGSAQRDISRSGPLAVRSRNGRARTLVGRCTQHAGRASGCRRLADRCENRCARSVPGLAAEPLGRTLETRSSARSSRPELWRHEDRNTSFHRDRACDPLPARRPQATPETRRRWTRRRQGALGPGEPAPSQEQRRRRGATHVADDDFDRARRRCCPRLPSTTAWSASCPPPVPGTSAHLPHVRRGRCSSPRGRGRRRESALPPRSRPGPSLRAPPPPAPRT